MNDFPEEDPGAWDHLEDPEVTCQFCYHEVHGEVCHQPRCGCCLGTLEIPRLEKLAIMMHRPGFEPAFITSGNSYPPPVAPFYGREQAETQKASFESHVGSASPVGTWFTIEPYPLGGRA